MHEVSICQSIFNAIEAEFSETQLSAIREIHVKIGVLSGIEPLFLQHVYKIMSADSLFKDASLHIERMNVIAECEHCARSFEVENYRFVCPDCGQPTGNVTEGNELEIHKIILEEAGEAVERSSS